ncbi:uncharacterized protein PAC_17103 [Phialocephala subalpina]|uniref:DUF6590 domain-containing protein n=1 Tax=Phialocephala subalpina TaxID=576137 RepID=A0A1L7XQ84_9HELO|nr:uncharacterized protein PAC_17103 [Phialocephala subalpina]
MSSSSRSKHRSKRSSSSSYYPTQWSQWEWDTERADWKRYRLKAKDEYEFEYESTSAAADSAEPRTPQPSLDPISEDSYSSSANYALSSGPSVAGITRGLAASSLASETTAVPPRNQTPGVSDTHITTINPYTDKEEFDPHYKVHKTFEFKQGRVFKVLWSEPSGQGGGRGDGSSNPETYTEGVNKFGEPSFQKVRRFVIIRPLAGHCICLPINTYSRQGVTKNGVHAGDHTIAYSGIKAVYFKGEKAKGLTKKPLKIVTKNPRHKLADTSRLNYAKTYTVEYNVKVWFIGNVDKDSMWHLITDFNQVHPPLGTQGLTEPSPFQDGETSYADGGMEDSYDSYTPQDSGYGSMAASYGSPASSYSQPSYSASYDQPHAPTEKYPRGSSHSERPSRSRGKGKAVQRDEVPEEDIAEDPGEAEHGYDKHAYEDPGEPEYDYDAYNQARHDEGDYAAHEYGPATEHHVVEAPLDEGHQMYHDPACAPEAEAAAYDYSAAPEDYEHHGRAHGDYVEHEGVHTGTYHAAVAEHSDEE